MKKALVLISMVGLGFLIAWAVSEDTSQQKAELESLKAEVQQLTTAIGKTEIERDTLKVRTALAEKNRDELQEQVGELAESRDKLQKQVEEFSFSRDQSRQQLAEIIVTRDNLKKQFVELTSSRDKIQEQLDELTTSRNQLRRRVSELTVSCNAAVAEVQNAQKRIRELVAMLEGETQKPSEPQSELIVTNQAAEDIQPPLIEVDRRPALHSFDTNRLRIMQGQTSTLSWHVSNAANIRIEPEVGPVTALGSRNVKPSVTTTYTLIAANNAGQSRQTCRIEVGEALTVQSQAIEQPDVLTEAVEPAVISSEVVEPAVISSQPGERPTCHSFNTNRPVIMPGQTSTLSWHVSNAASIRIEPEVGPVTALGSRNVKPSVTTTYTLIAANNAGQSRQTCRIEVGEALTVQSQAIEQPAVLTEAVEPAVISSEVVEPAVISSQPGESPTCHSFDTNRPVIMPGQTSTISWQVSNAGRIWIEPEVGPVTALGSRNVKPSKTTTYTLIAANKAGQSRQTCRIEVGEAPDVQNQDIEQPGVLAEVVEPPVTSKIAGLPVVGGQVSKPPTLHSFNTIRPAILPGQTSTLSWQVSNAERIRIEPEIGSVSALGSRTVKPSVTTTYTLIATNRAGDSKLSQIVEVSERINIFSSDSIGSGVLLEEYKASADSKVLPGQKPPVSNPDKALGKFLGYRARKDESGKFVFIPVYENKQEE